MRGVEEELVGDTGKNGGTSWTFSKKKKHESFMPWKAREVYQRASMINHVKY